jgi:hypothetical protein
MLDLKRDVESKVQTGNRGLSPEGT